MSDLVLADGDNIVVGTGTGTKIGTSTSQKLGFFDSTPIAQPSGDVATALSALGLVASPTFANVPLLNAANFFSTVQTITPSASGGALNIKRLGSGNGNAQLWSVTVQLADATDTLAIGVSSSAYSTGGVLAWIGNNQPFIYYPSSVGLKIGTGTGSTAAVTLDGSGNTTLGGNLTVDGSGIFDGTLTVTNTATMNGELVCNGFLLATSDVTIDGTTTFNGAVDVGGQVTFGDSINVALGSSFGTKFGTASTQKIGFLGAAPASQQSGGAKTAAATYGANEQTMLQAAYNFGRTFGFLS